MLIRDRKIDILRGIAILLVVLGHYIQVIYSPLAFDDNLLFRIIYSFHMPLFIFISGWLSYGKENQTSSSLSKKALARILPFYFWSLFGLF